MGDITREATSDEVGNLKRENERLKILFAELMLENSNIKKSLTGSG
jgi:transposase